jgi:IMP dehydrogenase
MNDFALTYDDVTLVPDFSDIESRKDPDPSTNIMGLELKTPIISANMDTVTESKMAIAMWKAGGLGILHRFMDVQKNCDEFRAVKAAGCECMVSIGAGPDWWPRAEALYNAGARHFVIDIAHGHSTLVKEVLKKMRVEFGDEVKIMAGNIATASAVNHMKLWGADAVKVGVGGGSICTTRVVTGFGVPMFTSVLECAKAARAAGMQCVADGGIRASGDIVKAIVAGADAVMVGRLLAGSEETPGETFGSIPTKKYQGMSSASTRQRIGSTALAEGIDAAVAAGGTAVQRINDLTAGLKSGMSYAGARELSDMRRVRWMRQTSHGAIEGTPHILKG